MRTLLFATLLLTSLIPVVPLAGAHHCAEPAPDESGGTGITVPENPTGISATLYVFVDPSAGASVWVESGQEPGLQTHQGTCRTSQGNQGHYGRDCELAALGLDASVSTDADLCGLLS